MPSTYTLISSINGNGSATTFNFSSIPSTYTDLVLQYSVREIDSGTPTTFRRLDISLFTGTATSSNTYLRGDGASAISARGTSAIDYVRIDNAVNGQNSTANTYGVGEVYIPNYTIAQNHPWSWFPVTETNATTAYITPSANLSQTASAISAIQIRVGLALNTASIFYLYGIKNS